MKNPKLSVKTSKYTAAERIEWGHDRKRILFIICLHKTILFWDSMKTKKQKFMKWSDEIAFGLLKKAFFKHYILLVNTLPHIINLIFQQPHPPLKMLLNFDTFV